MATPYLLRMSLSLPLTLSQFNASQQLLLRRELAAVAGLPDSTGWTQVSITNITTQSRRRRHLLENAISVAVAISLASAAAAAAAAAALSSPGALNAAFASVGLPPAQITSGPVVVVAAAAASPPPAVSSGAQLSSSGRLAGAFAMVGVALTAGAASSLPAWCSLGP